MNDTAARIDLHPVSDRTLTDWLNAANAETRAWVAGHGFKAAPGTHLIVPGTGGAPGLVLCGVSAPAEIWDLAALPMALPEGTYALRNDAGIAAADVHTWQLGWQLGSYRFDAYRKPGRAPASLAPIGGEAGRDVDIIAAATHMVRDLINTPANDMGPSALAAAAKALAARFGAEYAETVGEALLTENYPAVHAVGRAAADAPRIVEITWGDPADPVLALVGKGVCFDTGGLDIKPSSGMKLMKKDMGGAAHVLGIAQCLMQMQIKARLKVLVPAVENAISGNAMRPLDVVRTRAGVTVEIGNTDAEGRVILADALARAGEATPDLIIDFATLTGAARVALGTELPALFCNDETIAGAILSAATRAADPLWRLPLWPGYRKMIEGKTADITNAPDGGYAGAITAALFLERFIAVGTPWAHIDVMAWNVASKPGRPEGGEAMGLRAFTEFLIGRYGRRT